MVAIGEEPCETAAHVETGTHAAVRADTQLEAPAAVLAADVTPVQTPPILDCAPVGEGTPPNSACALVGEDRKISEKRRPEDLGEVLYLYCICVLSILAM